MMKKVKTLLASLALGGLLAGCTFSNDYGECIGLDDQEQPHLKYEISTWNIVMGVLFVEMLVPPVVVALEATKCPTGRR